MISVIIINYNSSIKMLDECIQSYINQKEAAIDLIVYDNNSKNYEELRAYESELKGGYPGITIQFEYSSKNLGFAKAVNNSVKMSLSEYVFISNFDIQVRDDTLKNAMAVMDKFPDCAGVASKVYFMHDRNLLDNVGTSIDSNGSAFNRGVGLYDIGQYDICERVFGVCFGACLLRRDLFNEDKVGLLDESYFMYYEDVDWCYRANLQGYKFYSAPGSVVYHYHSLSVKNLKYGFKFRLIERNLFFMVVKNFERKHMMRIIVRRALSHGKNFMFGRFRTEILKIYLDILFSIPRLIKQRYFMQKRRVIDDFQIFFLSYYEIPFFLPMEYAPILNIDALMFIYKRLYLVTGNSKYHNILINLELLNTSNLKFKKEFMDEKLSSLFRDEPGEVMKYIDNFKKGKGIF